MDTGNPARSNEPEIPLRSSKQIQVFLVCLAIATAIWLMIKLSKEYNFNIAYQVTYINCPPGKTMNHKADSVLLLTVRSSGYHVLYRKFVQPREALIIDISQIRLKKNGSNYEGTLQTNELSLILQSQLPASEKLTDIYPRNLSFRFENVYSKKVPVKPRLDLNYKSQFGLYRRVYLSPDSVTVTGPSGQMQEIHSVTTPEYRSDETDQTLNFTLPLMVDGKDKNITLSEDYVRIMVPVAQFTEASVNVPVKCDSLPHIYSVNTYPPSVKVVYRVALQDYKKVNANSFTACISGNKAMQAGNHKLKVHLAKSPSFVRVISVEPEKVEFILNK